MKKTSRNILIAALIGLIIGIALMMGFNQVYHYTSENETCTKCHYHPESDASWKQSVHCMNGSGTVTGCAECHLPTDASRYRIKIKMGIKDLWSMLVHDPAEIDYSYRNELDYARKIVYNDACEKCHQDLIPKGISDDGIVAHLYYEENRDKLDLQCISCHMDAGHFDPNYTHKKLTSKPSVTSSVKYEAAAEVKSFENFTETVPGTGAAIRMIAIPGGSFTMGSSDKEPFHQADEAPQKKVTVSPFFMAETEITWDQFWEFFNETMSEGRIAPETIYKNNSREDLDVDAISGPTPPFGAPDQGWGQGSRPAITMTHYSAETFCRWLSLKTGRKYRLPTEAEWEYAARAGSADPYFFSGNPRKFSSEGFLKGVFKPDTAVINSYVVYALNSRNRTAEPSEKGANAFGLKNMLGNVMEYCSDWYSENAYELLKDGAVDPKGPADGTEYVVRGGFYASDASQVRSAARGHTDHNRWLRTDPQNPKSIWWYSDVKGIGFRVVCEVPENIK